MSNDGFGRTAQASAPRIPAPPPAARGGKRGAGDGRARIWILAVLVGAGLGAGAYQLVPGVDFYFDYWVALALG